jgi:hypothetical protein
MRKNIKFLLIFFLAGLISSAGFCWYFFSTPFGAEKILHDIFARRGFTGLTVRSCRGDFFNGWVFRNLTVSCDFYTIGPGVLQADEAGLKFSFPGNFDVTINNGTFKRPVSDPVVFYGTYRDKMLDFNFYTKRLDIKRLFLLFFKNNYFVKNISGEAEDVDIYLRGTIEKPVFTGKFLIKKLAFKDFFAKNVPASLALSLDNLNSRTPGVHGEIIFVSGTIGNPHSAAVVFKKSRIVFNGDPSEFVYDLGGNAKVDNIKIDISLRGNRSNPDLKIFSEPSLPRDELLLMVMTNRTWLPGNADSSASAVISSDLAADAIDYFVFAGEGKKLYRAVGIGVSVNLNQNSRTVCITKNLGDKLAAGYAITQCRTANAAGSTGQTTHAVTGEYKVTDTVSIEAAHGLDRAQSGADTTAAAAEEKVMLKYKKEF